MTTKSPVSLFKNLKFSLDGHEYFTRQSSERRFLLPAYRTGAGQRTLHYRAMVAWNSLPRFLVNETGKNAFKIKLKVYLFTQGVT